jgi:hypothetical protein
MRLAARLAKLETKHRPPEETVRPVSIIVHPGETARQVVAREHPARADLLEIASDTPHDPHGQRPEPRRASRGHIRLIVRQIVTPPPRVAA